MSGKTLVMAQEFARMCMRAWRNQEPMRCLVVLRCMCHASSTVDATERRYEELVEGYLKLVREHVCPTKNEHDLLVEHIVDDPPWQDV